MSRNPAGMKKNLRDYRGNVFDFDDAPKEKRSEFADKFFQMEKLAMILLIYNRIYNRIYFQ